MALRTLSEENDSSKFLLTAINTLLQLINENPIQEEEDVNELLEAQIAFDVIVEAKKEVLGEGWDFNTDNGYAFPPDQSGYISIPANVLDLSSPDGDLIMRDWRLYSKSSQSAIFDKAQSLDVIWDMEFNSLTSPLRYYITTLAGMKFQARQVMDDSVYRYTQEDVVQAYTTARKSEGKTGNYNMLTSGQYGSNYNVRQN